MPNGEPQTDTGDEVVSSSSDSLEQAASPEVCQAALPTAERARKSTLARVADVPLAIWDAIIGFDSPRLLIYASALSFDSVFAIVPFLVLTVTAFKWLGAYGAIKSQFIEPWIHHMFRLQPESGQHLATLKEAFIQVFDLVEHARIGGLGLIGLLAMLYLIWAVVRTIEFSLNAIFEAEQPRGIGRVLRDYSIVLFILPACCFLIAVLLLGLGHAEDPGPILQTVVELNSVAIGCLGIAVLYIVMPNTGVPVSSALLGAVLAAGLGYLAFAVQVYAQIGVFRYNALYSGFAFVPLFLLWIFMSWLSVLFGAEVAAAHARRRRGGTGNGSVNAAPEGD